MENSVFQVDPSSKVSTEEVKPESAVKKQFLGGFFKKIKIPSFNAKKFSLWVFAITIVFLAAWFAVQYFTYKVYRVMVSNVSSRSATISWVTESAEPGMVVYKEGSSIFPIRLTTFGANIAIDDRDYSTAEIKAAAQTRENLYDGGEITAEDIVSELSLDELGRYWTHHVTIRNLEPETEYEFMVGNGNLFKKIATVDTDAKTFTTMSELEEVSTPDPAYGVIRYYDEDTGTYIRSIDAIVYATLYEEFSEIESEPISSVTNLEGGWYLDMSNALTSDDVRFVDVISEYEAVNIIVKLTIENTLFGRWSKDINYLEVSPADVIDLGKESKDLEYEGISASLFEERDLLLIKKVFADCSSWDFKCLEREDQEKKNRVTAGLLARSASYAGQAARYAAEQGDFASAQKFKNEVEAVAKTIENINKDGGKTDYSYSSNTGKSNISKQIKKNKEKAAEDDKETFNIIEDIDKLVAQNDDDNPEGQCAGDRCTPGALGVEKLRCGSVTGALCNCICGDESFDIGPGQYCSCTKKGKVNKDSSILGTVVTPVSEGAQDRPMCSNNSSGGGGSDKVCYSSTNNCWYGVGYSSNNGLECFGTNTTNQRWIVPSDKEYWEAQSKGDSGPEGPDKPDTLEACKAAGGVSSRSGNYWKCVLNGKDYYYLGSFEKIVTEYACCHEGSSYTWKTGCSESDVVATKGHESCEQGMYAQMYAEITTESTCIDTPTSKLVMLIDGKVYKCENGSYKEAKNRYYHCSRYENYECLEYSWYEIAPGKYCPASWDHTYIKGVRYECDGNKWVKSALSSSSISAAVSETITDGETCPSNVVKCQCKTHITVTTGDPYDMTGESSTATTHTLPKVIMINPGDTCEPSSSDITNNRGVLSLVSDVLAADASDSNYILDTKTGLIQGLNVGIYTFENNGKPYVMKIDEEDIINNPDGLEVYADIDADGVYDEGTDIKITDQATILTIEPIIEGFVYQLEKGFNFISFPFVFDGENINMASELLNYLNEKYDNSFYSIAKFDSGRWKVVGSNGGNFDQNDFQIIPGEGYLLKAKWDLDITLYGKEVVYDSVKDSAPIGLMEGWNLIGLYGTGTKSYTAEKLLEDISEYDDIDFTAVNVSRWLVERSLYEGLQREENKEGITEIYGLDFPINKKTAYFVKVTEGRGNWEPELR